MEEEIEKCKFCNKKSKHLQYAYCGNCDYSIKAHASCRDDNTTRCPKCESGYVLTMKEHNPSSYFGMS